MREELKPCPFCRSDNLWIDGGEYLNIFSVNCTRCGGRIGYFNTKAEAIAAWNSRACHKGHWTRSDDEGNVWQCSVCGNEWQLMDGTPEENHMNYCQQCGAYMSADDEEECWILHEDNTGWECPRCHAVIELDKGRPKDKYINHCPVCGLKLE